MKICSANTCPVNGGNTCCRFCPDMADCGEACMQNSEACGHLEETSTDMTAFNQQYLSVFKTLKENMLMRKGLEAQEKVLKDELRKAMEDCGIKSIDNEFVKVTYIPPAVAVQVDAEKLRGRYPQIAAECSKEVKRSSYIKVEAHGNTMKPGRGGHNGG